MTDWKHSERRIASLLGGRRVPVTGRHRGDAPDVEHPWLAIEVKTLRKHPVSWTEALDQARAASTPQQLPIAVHHAHGARYADAVVMVRLADFLAHVGDPSMQTVQHHAEETDAR